MVLRGLGALFRALIICLMVYYPSLSLTDFRSTTGLDISLLFGLIAAIVILIEYSTRTPSMIEFSMAPPYNRFRMSVFVLVTILLVTTINPTQSTGPLFDIAGSVTNSATFILGEQSNAVRRLVLSFGPRSAEQEALIAKLATSGLFVSFVTVALFSIILWLQKWPLGRDGFNLWPNMPSFHARAGHKTETRMIQVALITLLLAISLPFVLPQLLLMTRALTGYEFAENSLSVFWVITIWAVTPAMLLMRSLALLKVAFLIDHLRKL